MSLALFLQKKFFDPSPKLTEMVINQKKKILQLK